MRPRPPSPPRRSDGVIADRLGFKVIRRSRRGGVAALGAVVSLLATGLVAFACTPPGVPFECECDMLTDYDDGWRLPVRVCAADMREAPVVARGCAQLGAPAPVQSCKCTAGAGPAQSCRHGCRD